MNLLTLSIPRSARSNSATPRSRRMRAATIRTIFRWRAEAPRAQLGVLARLDEQHELHCRLGQVDRHLRIGEAGAVDHLGPIDQLAQRRRLEAEPLRHRAREELGAAQRLRIPELLAARVGAEG